MPASDVKLVQGQVIVEAWDLALDAPDRRKVPKDKSPHRRALVHDYNDGLTINWAKDYPGGVTLSGVKTIEGDPNNKPHPDSINFETRVLNCKATDLMLDNPGRRKDQDPKKLRRALVHDPEDGLTINWAGDYPGGVTIQGDVKTEDVHLSGQIVVPFTINLKTKEILAPSEINAETSKKALQLAKDLKADVVAGRVKLPVGRPKPSSKPKDTLSLHDSLAVLAQKGVQPVEQITLALDMVKMLADLVNDVNALKKRVEKLDG